MIIGERENTKGFAEKTCILKKYTVNGILLKTSV
jgi:hypothetical protein